MYRFWWLLVLLLFSSQEMITSVDAKANMPPDWRIVTYEDLHLMASTHLFERKEFTTFARFGLDLVGDQIIVGIRDNLLRLSLSNLSLIEVVPWLSDNITVTICLSKGQSKVRLIFAVITIHACATVCITRLHHPSVISFIIRQLMYHFES